MIEEYDKLEKEISILALNNLYTAKNLSKAKEELLKKMSKEEIEELL